MPDIVIDTVTIARNASAAESFDTEEELLSEFREDGYLAFAEDTQRLFFRCASGWRDVGGRGIIQYETQAELLADSPADGNIGFAADVDSFYCREASAWVPFAASGGENNSGANVGTGASLFKDKIGVTLRFRTVVAASNKLVVTEGVDTVTIDAVPANIAHQSLSGAGANTHAEIDTALGAVADHLNDVTIHRSIDDAGTSNTDLFSAAHILSELTLKRDTATPIDHETELSNVGVNTHSEIDTALADAAAHFSDATIHRSINDSGTSTTDLLSASKINALLSAKADDADFAHLSGDETIAGTKTFTSTIEGSVSGNAGTVTTNADLTGEVASSGNTATLSNAAVIAKLLTGYVSAAGTVADTDSILGAIQKLNGNILLRATASSVVHNTGFETVNGVKTFSSPIVGSITGNAATVTTNANLVGEVTSAGSNTTTLDNAAVISKLLSGFTSGAGTISSSDTLLSAIQKLSGNIAAKADDSGVVHLTGTETIGGTKSFSSPVDFAPTNSGSLAALSCGDAGTGIYGVTGGSLIGLTVLGSPLLEMKLSSGYGTGNVVQYFGDLAMADGGYGVTQLILRASSTPPTSPVTAGLYYDSNTNTPQFWDGSAWQSVGGGGGGAVDAGDLLGTTLAATVTASSLSSLGVLASITINGAAASYFGTTTGNFTAFLDCASTAQAVDLIFRKGGSNGFEFIYDTRDGNGYPWVGPSGAGLAFIGYGDRLTLGISAFDYAKYGWIIDLDTQQMSTGCQLQLLNLSADPTAMGPGAEYFNTTLGKKRIYTGSAWETVTSV